MGKRIKKFQRLLDACAAQPTDWLLAVWADGYRSGHTTPLSRAAIRRTLKKRRALIDAAEQHASYGRDRQAAEILRLVA